MRAANRWMGGSVTSIEISSTKAFSFFYGMIESQEELASLMKSGSWGFSPPRAESETLDGLLARDSLILVDPWLILAAP